MKSSLVIYTDLDGTLMDSSSYSTEAARPALELIHAKKIPLVFCTSKTRSEIEAARRELRNQDPFISENGGGIFIPEHYFPFSFPFSRIISDYKLIELGTPYAELRRALQSISRKVGVIIRGYGDLSEAEIAGQTGLNRMEAARAKKREYDEPFILEGTQGEKAEILRQVGEWGLCWTKGGRYYHLTGKHDKGRAIRTLTGLYEKKLGRLITVGLGDNANDLPMLEAVDRPILVQKPGGIYEETTNIPNLIRAEGIGPEGWNQAVLKILDAAQNRQKR